MEFLWVHGHAESLPVLMNCGVQKEKLKYVFKKIKYYKNLKTQVFSIVIEWMSNLPKQVLDSLETVMYDDMCHLAKYSKNPVRNIFQNFSVQYIHSIYQGAG